MTTLMKRKKKQRPILGLDSTEDPAHGKQENVAFKGHFGKNCFHPLFAFRSDGELFPRIGFIVTKSMLPAGKVIKVWNGRGYVGTGSKKNTLRWDRTSCRRFAANQARLLMGVLAYNLLHMLRQFYLHGEEVKRSMEWLIRRLIKVGAKVAYHGRRWHVHVASGFPQSRSHGKLFRCTVV